MLRDNGVGWPFRSRELETRVLLSILSRSRRDSESVFLAALAASTVFASSPATYSDADKHKTKENGHDDQSHLKRRQHAGSGVGSINRAVWRVIRDAIGGIRIVDARERITVAEARAEEHAANAGSQREGIAVDLHRGKRGFLQRR